MRLHKVRKKLARLLAALYDYAIGQIKLIVWWILRHDPVPVAFVKRVEMLVDDGLWVRLSFERWQFQVLGKSDRCPSGQSKKGNGNKQIPCGDDRKKNKGKDERLRGCAAFSDLYSSILSN